MQHALEEIKYDLCSPPVLAYPDFRRLFLIVTDSSSKAIGAVLVQKDGYGHKHTIQCARRCLNGTDQNYSTFEKRALEVVFALKRFRIYLLTDKLPQLRTTSTCVTFSTIVIP